MAELDEEIHKILEQFGMDMTNDLIESLRKKKVTQSGGQDSSLAGSIKFKVYGEGMESGVVFTMSDYWQFVEDGRNAGKMPPITAIEQWIENKGIVPKFAQKASKTKRKVKKRASASDRFKSQRRSLAFLIARSIAKKGTIKRFGYKGSKFASEVLMDGRIKELEETLAEKFGLQIVVDLTEALKPKVKV